MDHFTEEEMKMFTNKTVLKRMTDTHTWYQISLTDKDAFMKEYCRRFELRKGQCKRYKDKIKQYKLSPSIDDPISKIN